MFIAVRAAALEIGTASSGNRGHAGRKGLRGGSASRGTFDYGELSPDTKDDMSIYLSIGMAEILGIDYGKAHSLLTMSDPGDIAMEYRQAAKEAICKSLAADTGIEESVISGIIHQWARTSNDTCYASLHIQKMIAEEFGVPLSDFQQKQFKIADKVRSFYLAKFGGDEEKLKAYALGITTPESSTMQVTKYKGKTYRMPYDEWRAMMSEQMEISPFASLHGSEKLTSDAAMRKVLRAMYNRTQRLLTEAGVSHINVHRGTDGIPVPKHSGGIVTSYQGNASESFSLNKEATRIFGSALVSVKVPRSRVLSCFLTGFGCMSEMEVVILGGSGGDICRVQKN
jgi:hypothetical protein